MAKTKHQPQGKELRYYKWVLEEKNTSYPKLNFHFLIKKRPKTEIDTHYKRAVDVMLTKMTEKRGINVFGEKDVASIIK